MATVDDVGVDLVRDHHEVALACELRQLLELLPVEDPPERVVGGAEEEEAGALVDGGAEGVEVDLVAALAPHHGAVVEPPAGLRHRLEERGIDRGQGADPVPRPGVRLDREVDPLHDVGDHDHPLRHHLPAREAPRREARERFRQAARRQLRRVAEVVRLHHPREAGANGLGHVEVHVRHPRRQHVGRVARPLRAAAPAERLQGYCVEVGRLAQARAPRASGPGPERTGCGGGRIVGRINKAQSDIECDARRLSRSCRITLRQSDLRVPAAAPGFRYDRAFAGRIRGNDRPWDSAMRTSL